MSLFLGSQGNLFLLHLCHPPQVCWRQLGEVCWGCSPLLSATAQLPSLCCKKTPRHQQRWAGERGEQLDGPPTGFATCPGTWLVLGPRVGRAAARCCNSTAFYLKTALSQEKRELLGMTVASGNPGEDRVGGKDHWQGPELGKTWRGTAALSATGHLRLHPL